MAFNEFPKTYYRYNESGEREGLTFKSEEDVEKGWSTWEEFSALPAPKVKSAAPDVPASAVEAGKRLVAAEADNVRLKDTVKLYEDFLAKVREDENCPEPLKAAIGDLFGEAPAEPAKLKPKRAKA